MENNKNNLPLGRTEEGIQGKIPKWNLRLENDLFSIKKNHSPGRHKKITKTPSKNLSWLNTVLLNITVAIPTAILLQRYLLKENMLIQFLTCVLIHHILLAIGRFLILGGQDSGVFINNN